MAVYRTAQGRFLDMSAMMTQNEKVRAVGNGKMNARGDTIDAHGRVVVPVTQKISEAYAKTVNNPGAQVKSEPQPVQAKVETPKAEVPIIELTDFEKQLNDELADDAEVEEIKQQERKGKARK